MELDFYKKWACQKMIESSQSNIWDGHWACAVLALTNLLEEKLVPVNVEKLILKNLSKTVEEHANEREYRENIECTGFTEQLLGLLSDYRHSCHALGHDVIYTSYLVQMLSRSQITATAELFDSMKRIISEFIASGPGFVTVNGEKNTVIDPSGIPNERMEFRLDAGSILDLVQSFHRPLHMEKGDMQLGHILTHGHAIVELKQMSSQQNLGDLAPSFKQRMKILNYANKLEDKEMNQNDPEPLDFTLSPLESTYWEQALVDSRHGHHYKYAYSYLKLIWMAGRTHTDFRLFSRIL